MSKKNQGAALVVIMKLSRLFLMLPCLALVEAELLDSFTVCVRFKITHFSYNFLTLESRDSHIHLLLVKETNMTKLFTSLEY